MSSLFPEYESFDGLGLANLIHKGVMSPTEILEAAIERAEYWNPKINAIIHKMYDYARSMAVAKPMEGVFAGVPILLKDILADFADEPICFGSRYAYNNHWISQQDSEVVKRLKQSGLIMMGKTNVPEFGLSPVTEPVLFGPTRNPWNLDYSPGGSSGGSAAAVAAGIVPIAQGGDGGGSLRMPAAYTGLFGFKPSRGRTPTGPLFMRVWQGMVVEHALTRSVRDSAAILDVLTGSEVGSPIALAKPSYTFLHQMEKSPKKLRIALIDKPFFNAEVDPEYLQAQKNAATLCESLGHQVIPAQFQLDEDVFFAMLVLVMAETAAGVDALSKQIGRAPKADEIEKPNALLIHAARIFTAADLSWALQVLDMTGAKLAQFFQEYDVILTPTLPFPAPRIGALRLDFKERVGMKLLKYAPSRNLLRNALLQASERNFSYMAFTALFNIAGNPAMSVPLYLSQSHMPIGIQFAADVGNDVTLFQLARQLELASPWDAHRPIVRHALACEVA